MSRSTTFVYILEADAVLAILPGWPDDIQVAVCLSPDGACDLAVHHKNEVSRVLDRIAREQGDALISVAPKVAGYPTRKVLFSEEQQLLSFLADSEDLTELACDYAINYRFTLEQGLNSDRFTASQAIQSQPEAPAMSALTKFGEDAALSARSKAFVTHLSLPSGYAAPAAVQQPECQFVTGYLEQTGDCLRLCISCDDRRAKVEPVLVTRVGFRDDYARFVLPRNALDGWEYGDAAQLDIPLDQFPEALVTRFLQTADVVQVTVTARGVFVSPSGNQGTVRPSAPIVSGFAQRPRRRLFRSVHVAVVGLVAVMVVTGHFAAALDQSTAARSHQPSSGQAVSSSDSRQSLRDSGDAGAALGLLAAMAQNGNGSAVP